MTAQRIKAGLLLDFKSIEAREAFRKACIMNDTTMTEVLIKASEDYIAETLQRGKTVHMDDWLKGKA